MRYKKGGVVVRMAEAAHLVDGRGRERHGEVPRQSIEQRLRRRRARGGGQAARVQGGCGAHAGKDAQQAPRVALALRRRRHSLRQVQPRSQQLSTVALEA